MRNICASFETWTIPDGSYNNFGIGDKEVFAIGIGKVKVKIANKNYKYLIKSRMNRYSFSGKILYCEGGNEPKIAIDTGFYRFFISGSIITEFKKGQFINGEGELNVDSYEWMHVGKGAPPIYTHFVVDKIRGENMPDEPVFEDEHITIWTWTKSFLDLQEDQLIEFQNTETCDTFTCLLDLTRTA